MVILWAGSVHFAVSASVLVWSERGEKTAKMPAKNQPSAVGTAALGSREMMLHCHSKLTRGVVKRRGRSGHHFVRVKQ